MSNREFTQLATQIITAIAALLVAFGFLSPDYGVVVLAPEGAQSLGPPAQVENLAEARGVSHFSSLSTTGILQIDETDNTTTGAQTITPAATMYELTPTAVTTVTLGTGSASVGDLLVLQNSGSANVVIVDTTATIGGGNITLGGDDTAIFVYANSKWVMLATANNS